MSSIAQFYAVKEDIRQAIPIDEVIGETIPLRRQGHDLVGAHHTHDSQSGTSFHVDPDRRLYHCFHGGCDEGGDVFTWIMALRRCSFPEALRSLADRVHISLTRVDG